MKPVTWRAAIEPRPEEDRGAVEDLVGSPQLAVFAFEKLHPLELLGREAGLGVAEIVWPIGEWKTLLRKVETADGRIGDLDAWLEVHLDGARSRTR